MARKRVTEERVVYGVSNFWIEAGFYTIPELETMLTNAKRIKARQDEMLGAACEYVSDPKS